MLRIISFLFVKRRKRERGCLLPRLRERETERKVAAKNLLSLFLPSLAQYRGKGGYFEKEDCPFGNRRIRFFSLVDETRRRFARAKRIRIGVAAWKKSARLKENRGGEKTKEHFDNEVLLEKLDSPLLPYPDSSDI